MLFIRAFILLLTSFLVHSITLNAATKDKSDCKFTLATNISSLEASLQQEILEQWPLELRELKKKLLRLQVYGDFSVLNLQSLPEIIFNQRVQHENETMKGWYGQLIFTSEQILKIFFDPSTGQIRYYVGQVERIDESSFRVTFTSSHNEKLKGKSHINIFKIDGRTLEFSNPENGFSEIWHIYDSKNERPPPKSSWGHIA